SSTIFRLRSLLNFDIRNRPKLLTARQEGLEPVMVIMDNSENSRNGDYTPTRYEVQADAVSVIFSTTRQVQHESSMGLVSMGGGSPEVLVTLTTNHRKILELYIALRPRFVEKVIYLPEFKLPVWP
ncbi:hypothetical protein B0O99DRAFT_716428, partial [Bisporella sp. PMI_857]